MVDVPLVMEGITKRYGSQTVVDGVSLRVERGQVVCVLGPNGAGKTTTLEMAQGLRRPTSGTVRVFGQDPRNATAALRKRLGVLPQDFTCFDFLTIRENLEYWSGIYRVRPAMDALLADLGLTESAGKKYNSLSGGMKRRVGIAAALVTDPELVFLDEPTAGLDPASRRQLWDVILRLRREGRAVVLTTHYMDEAERLSDVVAMMRAGRVVAQGSPAEVRRAHGGPSVVTVKGLRAALPPALSQREGFASLEDGTVVIPLHDAADGPRVIEQVVRSGVAYDELAIREPTLDDTFLRLAREA